MSLLLQAFSNKCYRQRGCKLASQESSGDMFQQLLIENTPINLLSRSKGSALWSDIELGSDLLGMSRVTSHRPRLLLWLQALGPTPLAEWHCLFSAAHPAAHTRPQTSPPPLRSTCRWGSQVRADCSLLSRTPGVSSITSGSGIPASVMLGALFMPSCQTLHGKAANGFRRTLWAHRLDCAALYGEVGSESCVWHTIKDCFVFQL